MKCVAALLGVGVVSAASAAEHLCTTPAGVAAAAERARPGDAVVLRDGTWSDADLRFEAEGTATQPVTLRAQTPGKVILTGLSRLRFSGSHLVVAGLRFEQCRSGHDVVEFRTRPDRYAHHSRLTDCSWVDCNPPRRETNTRWISLYGTENRVDHCQLASKANLGCTLVVWLKSEPVRHRIDHNHFGPRPRLQVNGGETIRVGDSTTSAVKAQCVVESNLFEACNGEAEIVSNKSAENVYRWNTFRRCEGALTLRVGRGCLVEGNFFLGEGRPLTGGVRVIDQDHRVWNNYFADLGGEGTRAAICLMNGIKHSPPAGYYVVQRALIAFNTLVNCRQNLVLGYVYHEATLPPVDCILANNIVVSTNAPLVRQVTAPLRTTWLGNVMFGAGSGLTGQQTGIVSVDPKLSRGADGLWRPAEDSPARGAAVGDFAFVTTDIEGQPRPVRKDAGCDQAADEPMLNRPLTAADVGPAWGKAQRSAQP